MPEAAKVTLNLPTGDSSETDRSNTTESPRNTGVGPGRNYKNNAASGQNKKNRKSTGGRRAPKKPPLKVNLQQKNVAALNLKSQIPRAFLTPSSSSTSLSNINTDSSSGPPSSALSSPKFVPARFVLQRQHSAAILNFRIQKSVSQMDFKQARRSGNLRAPASAARITELDNNSKALVPSSDMTDLMATSSQNSLVKKMLVQDEQYYYVLDQDRDPKVAGMRIFATIMLNAWRKRRNEVKRLLGEVDDLKRGSIKAKNQLHVFNTLFRVEQRRNDELSCQLKRSMEDISNTRSSVEGLTTSLISLKADKALLEQQLQNKDQEFDGLNTILTQTKSELFKAMTQQRELQANLSMEQRKVQLLENQKNDLINEICELNTEALQKEEKLREQLEMKEADIEKALADIKLLEEQVAQLNQKNLQVDTFAASEARLRQEIEALQFQVDTLRSCLAATLGSRLKTCWDNSITYQKATFKMLHWVAFYMLPATPPPKINFGLTLEKALSIVKR